MLHTYTPHLKQIYTPNKHFAQKPQITGNILEMLFLVCDKKKTISVELKAVPTPQM